MRKMILNRFTSGLLRLFLQQAAVAVVLLVVCLVGCPAESGAKAISREQALSRAKAFMQKRGDVRRLEAVTNARKLAPRRFAASVPSTEQYYVFNKGQGEGFVIISGDDRTIDVLGYCDKGDFDYDQLPPNMREWLDDYALQIGQLQQDESIIVRDAVPTHDKVAQLMKSTWNQGNPYNLACPNYFNLGLSVTGCVATAMAQILYYNREKSVTETQADMPAYTTWTEHPTYGRLKVDGIPAGSPIDWDNMKDSYGSATEKQKMAVADLMHYCGVSVNMDYTNSSSGAQSYNVYTALKAYFGYGSSVRYVSYADVSSDTEWDRIIYAEMAAGRPIYISGSNSGGGHAFVCDGYDGNLRYHINWGWGGTADGYYYLTNLTPGQQGIGGSNDGYNDYREIIIGIEPENYGEKPMTFSDNTLKQICLQNWDADGDGKLTYSEAASVKDIGKAFSGQESIKKFGELYYFTSLESIPDDAFSGCSQLLSVRLPKGVKHIGDRAFKGCAKMQKMIFPDNLTTIGAEAFSGCSQLSNFILPDGIQAIAAQTFKDCAAVTAIDLPIGVTAIGDAAFEGCRSLASFTLKTYHPEAVELGTAVFGSTDLSAATLNVMQGTKSYYQGDAQWGLFGRIVEKRELSGGAFVPLEAGKKYYIYNVGKGSYLTKGEAYGTQAVVGDSPMRFQVNHTSSMPEGIYYLTSEDTGKSGRYLFRTSTDGNVGNGVMATFVDGGSMTTNSRWSIQPIGNNVYTFQIPETDPTYAEGKFWGVQTDHESQAASPTYGVYSDVSYADHPSGCQWQFVLYDEQTARLYQEAETLASLIDMATKRKMKVDYAQAVYDNMESTLDDVLQAQRQLRKSLGLMSFADETVRARCVNRWDINTDGELSYTEASQANDFDLSFQNSTTLVSFDELRYFTSAPSIYGNTFDGCTNLQSVVLPDGIVHIYYRAFRNCKKLASINIPRFVSLIGANCFEGCSALRTVTIDNVDPSTINVDATAFKGLNLSVCTLKVPFGSKALFEAAPVWKSFGTIVEVRGYELPKTSYIAADQPGYLMNVGTRKMITLGEAYGTQSVVSAGGQLYQLKHLNSMPEGVYALVSSSSGKAVFRTNTDSKVGSGIKACFGDGNITAKAYWKLDSVAPGVYTFQVPVTDADYARGEYLGVDESHSSYYTSPTYGLYWDVTGTGVQSQWVFIKEEDLKASEELNELTASLREMIATATERNIDVSDEQGVYDNAASTIADMRSALLSVRQKLHLITFADDKARSLCLMNWDTDNDGELSWEEAAEVKDIGEVFRGVTTLKEFGELRYFTSLTEIPDNAFRGATAMQYIIIPATVEKLGDYAFSNCGVLRYVVLLNDRQMVPAGYSGIGAKSTLFVPANMVETYKADATWSAKSTILEYTGIPVVTAQATRMYGRSVAAVELSVTGAPVNGTPAYICDAISEPKTPVGTYVIVVTPGTITVPGLVCQNGTLVIEKAQLTVTAKDCQRRVGEQNPEFELTYKGFRNRETDTVFVSRPVVSCLATADSPAGEYAIEVSGGEARNYSLVYVPGVLTVVDADGIRSEMVSGRDAATVYDLQGRRVSQPRSGLYISGKRKLFIRK